MEFLHSKRFFPLRNILQSFLYLLCLFIASLASFWRELFFTFTKDDWGLFWSSLYTPKGLLGPYWLHPATPIEFLLFSHLFEYNPFLWMLLGLCIRVGISYGVYLFINALTKSKVTGVLAGLFFASTYASLESIGFISAHAGSISLFFIILSFYFFTRLIQEKKYSPRNFLLFYFVGFFLDPGRSTPTIILFPLLYIFLKKEIPKRLLAHWKRYVAILIVIGVIVCTWFVTHSEGSLFTIFFTRFFHDYTYLFKKLYLFGNYFAALGNLLLGWLIPLPQDAQNTGVYNGLVARFGILVAAATCFILFFYRREKNKMLGIIAFFLLWMFLFYIPNWFFEPRAPMSGAHRYQVFPAVGFVSLVAYGISFIRIRWVGIIATLLFIGMNIYTANRILAFQETFRSKTVVERMWQQIDREVPKRNERYLFIFTGEQPILSQSLEQGGIFFYGYKRNISHVENFPVVTNYVPTVMQYLCSGNPILLENVFAWNVNSQGMLKNNSLQERALLSQSLGNCH